MFCICICVIDSRLYDLGPCAYYQPSQERNAFHVWQEEETRETLG